MPLAKHDRVATDPLAFRVLIKVAHYGVENARKIKIVAIEKREDVARCSFQTLVDCMHLAAIFLAYPVSQSILVTTNDRDTFIGAAAIDHHVLEWLVSLIEH